MLMPKVKLRVHWPWPCQHVLVCKSETTKLIPNISQQNQCMVVSPFMTCPWQVLWQSIWGSFIAMWVQNQWTFFVRPLNIPSTIVNCQNYQIYMDLVWTQLNSCIPAHHKYKHLIDCHLDHDQSPLQYSCQWNCADLTWKCCCHKESLPFLSISKLVVKSLWSVLKKWQMHFHDHPYCFELESCNYVFQGSS